MSSGYPPFAVWSDSDHSGPVIIATTLCMFYWLALGIIQQGIILAHNTRLGWADGIFTLSMVTGVVQSALLLRSCHFGFGKSETHLQPDRIQEARKYYYLSNLFYVLVLGLIKCSASLFIIRLTVNNGSLRQASRPRRAIFFGISFLIAAWTIASIVVLALPCRSNDWCTGTMNRWRGIVAGDVATDIAIATFAALIIWRTQASVRSRFMWYIPFTVRLCVPIVAGVRLVTINQSKLTHNPTLAMWLFAVLSQLQIFLSMVGGTSPALKKTLSDLVTNFGANTDSQNNSKQRTAGSYAMKDLRYANGQRSGQGSNSGKKFVPFVGGTSSNNAVIGRRDSDHDVDSDSQKGIMRRDEIQISYENSRKESYARDKWI